MWASAIAMGALWTLLSSDPNAVYMGSVNQYDALYEKCAGKAGRACCEASVDIMRKEDGHPAAVGSPCPPGQKVSSIGCPASLTWCRPLGVGRYKREAN